MSLLRWKRPLVSIADGLADDRISGYHRSEYPESASLPPDSKRLPALGARHLFLC